MVGRLAVRWMVVDHGAPQRQASAGRHGSGRSALRWSGAKSIMQLWPRLTETHARLKISGWYGGCQEAWRQNKHAAERRSWGWQ